MALFRSLSAIADLFKDLVDGGKAWHSNNDGAGSGLDADKLDGLQGSQFLRSDTDDTTTGNITATSFVSNNSVASDLSEGSIKLRGTAGSIVLDADYTKRITWNDGNGNFQMMGGCYSKNVNGTFQETYVGNNGATKILLMQDGVDGYIQLRVAPKGTNDTPLSWANSFKIDTTGIYFNGGKVWHAGNDGSGSGLDADLLDGLNSIVFLKNNGVKTSGDFNSFTTHGYYNINATDLTNQPNSYWGVLVVSGNSDRIIQIFHSDVAGGGSWIRRKQGSTWHPWERLLTSSTGKAVDADKLDGKEGQYYLDKTADNMSNITGNWHTFVNDGGGNVGQRWNSTPGATSKLIENGIAYELKIDNDSTNGSFTIYQSDTANGIAGEDITWISIFNISGTDGSVHIAKDLYVNGSILKLPNLPTSDPAVSGQVWNNNGVMTISAG